jgi:hypothetical protein
MLHIVLPLFMQFCEIQSDYQYGYLSRASVGISMTKLYGFSSRFRAMTNHCFFSPDFYSGLLGSH